MLLLLVTPCLCSEYVRVLNMPLVLNMPGLWLYQGSEYAGITQSFEYPCIFLRHAFYINLYKVLLPLQKTLWTSWKLLQKVENCYVIVKRCLPVAGFLAHFAHFSLQYDVFTLIWDQQWTRSIDQRYSMLKTLEIPEIRGYKKLSLEHTL